MKKAVVVTLVGVGIGVAVGWALFFRNGTTPNPPDTNSTSTGTTTPTTPAVTIPSGWKAYRNTIYRLSFYYPPNGTVEETANMGWSYTNADPGTNIVEITIPKDFEPGTNFSEAKFHVGKSDDAVVVANCLKREYENQKLRTETVNGITFTVLSGGDAGAGNFYETESYRTIRNGDCYAVELLIHSTNVANYPEELNITEFNKARVNALLHQMIDSFIFFRDKDNI